MARVLVIQMAKLGDFIQSTPLLSALRARWPGRSVLLAGSEAAVLEAARLSPLVDETLAIGPGGPDPEGEFEAVYNLNSAPAAAQMAGLVRAGQRFGPLKTGPGLSFTPVQEFIMGLMAEDRRLGRFNLADVWLALAPEAGPRPLFWPATAGAEDGPALRVGFHLGARHHLRRWPAEYFARLARTLGGLAGEFIPILTGSEGERALGAKFARLGPPARHLFGATDLVELSRVLSGLDLLVTADTGILHLAAALRTPTLALFFGPAYGPETGPYGPGHLIYQAEAPCGPCREGACRKRQCLALPDPDQAAHLAASFLAGRPLEELAEPPPGHRLWLTEADSFGQKLLPLGRPALTAEEALALALTWAGQTVLRPGFEPSPDGLASLAGFYASPDGRMVLEAARCRRLGARLGRGGLDRLVQGLEILGLEIANL